MFLEWSFWKNNRFEILKWNLSYKIERVDWKNKVTELF